MRLSNRKMNWLRELKLDDQTMNIQWLNHRNSHRYNHNRILLLHHSYVRPAYNRGRANHNRHRHRNYHIHNLLKIVHQYNFFRPVVPYRIDARDLLVASKLPGTPNIRTMKLRRPSPRPSKGRNILVGR